MGNKVLKILFGVLLIPLCAGFTWQFGVTFFSVTYRPGSPYYFLAGAVAYLSVHVLFRKPILTYVFGHELTHALFAMIFGGSVKSFHASERGGHVTITKSNFLITLAPYFFPLYTVIVLMLYWLARVADVHGAEGWLVFFSGTTFTFHMVLTFTFLRADQNDIREQGAIFSYPLIFLFNVMLTALLIDLMLAQDMDFLEFFAGGIIKSVRGVSIIAGTLFR